MIGFNSKFFFNRNSMKYLFLIIISISSPIYPIVTNSGNISLSDNFWFLRSGNDNIVLFTGNNGNNSDLVIIKANDKVAIGKHFDGSSNESYRRMGLFPTSNENFIIATETNRGNRQLLINKIDKNLNIIKSFRTLKNLDTRFMMHEIINDERFLIAGWMDNLRHHFIMELDTNLNLIKQAVFNIPSSSVLTNLIKTENAYSFISSHNKRHTLTRLDSNFNLLSHNYIPELDGINFRFKEVRIDNKIYIPTSHKYGNTTKILELNDEGFISNIHDLELPNSFIPTNSILINDKLRINGKLMMERERSLIIELDSKLNIINSYLDTSAVADYDFTKNSDGSWGGYAVKIDSTIEFFNNLPCNFDQYPIDVKLSSISNVNSQPSSISKVSNIPTTNNSYWTHIGTFTLSLADNSCSKDLGPCPTSFNYPQTSESEFQTIQYSRFENGKIILTDSGYSNAGAVNFGLPIDISKPFETEFDFTISGGFNGFKDGSLPGADGIVLLLSADLNSVKKINREKLGGNLFYNETKNGFALEIDTYNNFLKGDPDGNHLAIQASKEELLADHEDLPPLAMTSDIPTILNDGSETYRCKMDFDGENLEVTLSRIGENLEPQIVIENFDFSEHINPIQDKFAYFYLMSSTGTSYARHEINSWKLCSDSDAEFISSVEFSESNDLIYPNPASDIINFSISGKKQLRIIDLQGREYFNSEITNNSLDVSFLSKGMYFCIVNGDKFAKFIKE